MVGDSAPARQRLDSERRREKILAVAARHFEERRYSDVSTGAIADDAGVGRPLIHYYFGTKRELYLEVVRRFALQPKHVGDVFDRVDDERRPPQCPPLPGRFGGLRSGHAGLPPGVVGRVARFRIGQGESLTR